MERRDFLKALGALCGGAALSSCGSSGDGGSSFSAVASPLPSAYRFFPLLGSGDALPGGAPGAAQFPGWSMLNSGGQVLFQAYDVQQATGLYLGQLDPSGPPRLSGLRLLLRDGQTAPDGQAIQRVEASCLNDRGDVAVRVMTREGHHRLYVARSGAALELAVGLLTPTPDGGRFSQSLGDFELLNDGSLVLVGHYSGPGFPAQGLFHLRPDGSGRLLNSSRATIPNSTDRIGAFGLLDTDGSSYAHQVTAHQSTAGLPTVVLQGDLNSPQTVPRVLAASPRLSLPSGVRRRVLSGEVNYGPRVSEGGSVAVVVSHAEGQSVNIDDQPVLQPGQPTPTGRPVTGMLAPLPGPGGSFFLSVLTGDGGSELLLLERTGRVRSLAQDGLQLGARQVQKWGLGGVRNQCDSQGRLICSVSYADQASGLVLGVPA